MGSEQSTRVKSRQNGGSRARKFDYMLRASDALAQAMSGDGRLARLADIDLIRAARNAAHFRATHEGAPVIAKLFFGPKAKENARAQADELLARASFASDGKYRVAPLVAAVPGKGVILMEHVDGVTLSEDIAAADRVATRRLPIREAGEWLAHITSEPRHSGGLAARNWLRQRERELETVTGPKDRDLARALAMKLGHLSTEVHGTQITRARSHGDFIPTKVLRAGNAIYGVDIKNATFIPLAKDLARFLVCLAVQMPGTGRSYVSGIQKADFDALLGAPGLISAEERQRVMPFFLGIEIAEKFCRMNRAGQRGDNIRETVARFCAD